MTAQEARTSEPDRDPSGADPTAHRVVIVGGGFGGLFAARALRRAPVQVTLVDRAGHHLFQPLLYQCATGILSEGQIAAPLRSILKRHGNVRVELAEVVDLDAERRQLNARRPGGADLAIQYDELIVAAGVQQSYFGHDEYAQWAPGMKTLADALSIRRRVFGAFEMAATATDPAEQRRWLTFALVGGGPTGVELAGQLRELASKTLRADFHHIDPDSARVLLFDGGAEPLASFGSKLAKKAADVLEDRGVELHMHSFVSDVDQYGLVVRDASGDQTRYDAGTVLWTAGVKAPQLAHKIAAATGAKQDKIGRIEVTERLTIPDHPEISVIGDVMSYENLPGVAEVAMQSGLYVGRRIRHDLTGHGAKGSFRYRDLGSAAYISRGHAVIATRRLHFDGFLGWLSWLFIHIAFLTGYRNRIGALMTWSLAFTRDTRRERAFTTSMIDTRDDAFAAAPVPAATVAAAETKSVTSER
jgi:NADH:ubiquinone reductase (H+-translocating)